MDPITPEGKWPHLAPKDTRIYAVPDLHGHLEAHDQLYAVIEQEVAKAPKKRHVAVYLGDYIDRGPQSSQLLDRLIELKAREDGPLEHVFLRGNHENGFLGFLEDPHGFSDWLRYGGVQAAKSYGVVVEEDMKDAPGRERLRRQLLEALPPEHYEFLGLLKLMHIERDYAFVHAGIQPEIPLDQQSEEDLVFIREPFLSWPHMHTHCIVHGHTIMARPDVRPNRIGLDTGLYQTGMLSCGIFEDDRVQIIQIDTAA